MDAGGSTRPQLTIIEQGIAGPTTAGPAGGRGMTDGRQPDALAVLDRLVRAQNGHDVDAMLVCFDPGYRSEQPIHPARAFTGSAQVRTNWSALFAGIRDFRSELLRTAVDGDTVWAESRWSGTKADGSPFEEMVVMILGISDGRITWARFYADEVERNDADIDETVRQMVGGGR
jgi:ketosteroid isomerase-like protein